MIATQLMKCKLGRHVKYFILANVIIFNILGCASMRENSNQCWPPDQPPWISTADSSHFSTNAKFPFPSFSIVRVNGRPLPYCGVRNTGIYSRLTPGRNSIIITTAWSNRFKDETEFTFEVVENKIYRIFAVELNPGQDPASVWIRPQTFGEEMLRSMSEGALTGAAPLVFLIGSPWYIYQGIKDTLKPPQERPAIDCCFV